MKTVLYEQRTVAVVCAAVLGMLLIGGAFIFFKKPSPVHLGDQTTGWTIPDGMLDENSVVYSIGVGEDASFDMDVVKRYNCNVFLFDPTPVAQQHVARVKQLVSAGLPVEIGADKAAYTLSSEQLQRLHMFPYGIAQADSAKERFFKLTETRHVSHTLAPAEKVGAYFEAPCRKLSTIMRVVGHTSIDLLKLEVGGAEYGVLYNMIQENVRPKILCVELRETKDTLKQTAVLTLQKAGYSLVHEKGGTDYTFVRA